MTHTFSHFGTRINLMSDEARPQIVETFTIPEAQELFRGLTGALMAAAEVAESEKEANREKFSLELGVNLNGERVCALEAGPFETSESAIQHAMAMRGRLTIDVSERPNTEWYDLLSGDADDLPIVGATLNIFTDAEGTVRDVTLY